MASRSAGTPSFSEAASNSSARSFSAASFTALPAIIVTRLEYEPRSTGASEVSPDTTWTSSGRIPSVSAATDASMLSEPCPISAVPHITVTPPPRSMRISAPECGIGFQ